MKDEVSKEDDESLPDVTNYPNNAKSLSALVTEQVPKVAVLPRGVPLVKMQDANAKQNHALVMLNDSTRNFLFA